MKRLGSFDRVSGAVPSVANNPASTDRIAGGAESASNVRGRFDEFTGVCIAGYAQPSDQAHLPSSLK
jgi:hypothetical protein